MMRVEKISMYAYVLESIARDNTSTYHGLFAGFVYCVARVAR